MTEAASLLGVGRPALSNVLNGRAALSPDMAARLERTFGASARELMDIQAVHVAARASGKVAAASARAYVPQVLKLTANDLEQWAATIAARSRLAVLLRTLVHSTAVGITVVDFPGNDDSERTGWDGFVESKEAVPWIPEGKSGWEFGVNRAIKGKADQDYRKAMRHASAEERADTTFVFVTPRRWRGKDSWKEERLTEGHWKDVRVLDASNLEQWIEQSIPAQVWLADELGKAAPGLRSLDECWRRWAADCKSTLTPALFEEAIERAGEKITTKMASPTPEPIVVTADSRDEALAFLSCLFSADKPDSSALRDRIVVFTETGPLARLAMSRAFFIPVVASPEVEHELAPHDDALRSILVYPRNATTIEPDIALEPLSYTAFEKALQAAGRSRDEIERLSRESGRSRTVLRRRLSRLPAIRAPKWASDTRDFSGMIPFLFAGAWKTSPADQVVLELLANGTPYATLEGKVAELLTLDDSPVWSIGSYRGLVSKIDSLFAIANSITNHDLERFFDVAKLVLSEDDPALDFPAEHQWMAGAFGKTREVSDALREGIGETLVLLSVHGGELFRARLDIDLATRVRRMIRGILTPLTARKLEAQSGDLPIYAEAAPDEFLDILDGDLNSPDPESLKVMRPVTATFGRCPRTGLLWALENTAWAPERLLRTVEILARLAKPVIDDNWANKPSETLGAIFRCWLPQTAANVEHRIDALNYLVKRYPRIAWPLCVAQFDGRNRVGHYSHKPRWRTDARGHGEPVTRAEIHRFAVHALECALAWKEHSHETLGDLVELAGGLDEAHQKRMWEIICDWAESASDEGKAYVRDKVRVCTAARRARLRDQSGRRGARVAERDRRAYDRLKPKDLLLEHAWLFRSAWVRESMREIADEGFDFQKREARIQSARVEALQAILAERGIDGVLELSKLGEAAVVVGRLLPQVLQGVNEQALALRSMIVVSDSESILSDSRRSLISGLLANVPGDNLEPLLTAIAPEHDLPRIMSVLLLAPFRGATWRLSDRLGREIEEKYWREVTPIWGQQTDAERVEAVDRLLAAGRPSAAFGLIHLNLDQLRPKQLFRLLMEVAISVNEPHETPRLDGYRIAEGFKLLTESGEIAVDEMAGLEYLYIEVLDREQASVPNLERNIDEHPELFVQAVVAAYRRSDDSKDPEGWRAPTPETEQARARKASTLLEKVSRIPGCDRQGKIDPARLRAWVTQVRVACAELARADSCDDQIGALLSRAPAGEDGIWPCEPVREVLDEIACEAVGRGLRIALYNARGMQMRGEGGHSERELAAKYASWASALEFTHPRVARILREMVEMYEHEAHWYDDEAGVRRRLLR